MMHTRDAATRRLLSAARSGSTGNAPGPARSWMLGLGLVLGLLSLAAAGAESPVSEPLTFGVVPQQSAGALARTWGPLLEEIGRRAGVPIGFRTAPDIPAFEARLGRGDYDLAYMNPYHFTVFNRAPGYRALARQRAKRIRGILVVGADSPIDDIAALAGRKVAFPAPAAFAASVLPQAALRQAGVEIEPVYVRSHESVYLAVSRGLYVAGGGIERTFADTAPETRARLRVLWRTEAFTPHAIAVHPRVDAALAARLQAVMVALADDDTGRALLSGLQFAGIDAASDGDWDDVRALGIDLIEAPAGDAP